MFSADDISRRIKVQPFVPVRIVTSAGQTFDVHHPDLVMVGRRELRIGTASSKDPGHYEYQTLVALIHVTALEDLPAGKSPSGNGEQ